MSELKSRQGLAPEAGGLGGSIVVLTGCPSVSEAELAFTTASLMAIQARDVPPSVCCHS